MDFETREVVEQAEYIQMIQKKTATLLAFSLQSGALMAGQNEQAKILYQIGIDLGIAFQLKDDYLDLYGSSKVGKKIGGDIKENKKTCLFVIAYEQANELDKNRLLELFSSPSNYPKDTEEKITLVKGIFEKYNVERLVEEKITMYFARAIQNLENLDVPKQQARESFTELIYAIRLRTY